MEGKFKYVAVIIKDYNVHDGMATVQFLYLPSEEVEKIAGVWTVPIEVLNITDEEGNLLKFEPVTYKEPKYVITEEKISYDLNNPELLADIKIGGIPYVALGYDSYYTKGVYYLVVADMFHKYNMSSLEEEECLQIIAENNILVLTVNAEIQRTDYTDQINYINNLITNEVLLIVGNNSFKILHFFNDGEEKIEFMSSTFYEFCVDKKLNAFCSYEQNHQKIYFIIPICFIGIISF